MIGFAEEELTAHSFNWRGIFRYRIAMEGNVLSRSSTWPATATRSSASGRCPAPTRDTLLGIPATGHEVVWRQCHLYRFDENGRAIEHDAIRDDVRLLRQLGKIDA